MNPSPSAADSALKRALSKLEREKMLDFSHNLQRLLPMQPIEQVLEDILAQARQLDFLWQTPFDFLGSLTQVSKSADSTLLIIQVGWEAGANVFEVAGEGRIFDECGRPVELFRLLNHSKTGGNWFIVSVGRQMQEFLPGTGVPGSLLSTIPPHNRRRAFTSLLEECSLVEPEPVQQRQLAFLLDPFYSYEGAHFGEVAGEFEELEIFKNKLGLDSLGRIQTLHQKRLLGFNRVDMLACTLDLEPGENLLLGEVLVRERTLAQIKAAWQGGDRLFVDLLQGLCRRLETVLGVTTLSEVIIAYNVQLLRDIIGYEGRKAKAARELRQVLATPGIRPFLNTDQYRVLAFWIDQHFLLNEASVRTTGLPLEQFYRHLNAAVRELHKLH